MEQLLAGTTAGEPAPGIAGAAQKEKQLSPKLIT